MKSDEQREQRKSSSSQTEPKETASSALSKAKPHEWAKKLGVEAFFYAAAQAANKWDRDPSLEMTQPEFETLIAQAKQIGANQ